MSLQSPDLRYLRDFLNFVKSGGEENAEGFNNRPSQLKPEMSNGQLFAEKFFNNGEDEYRVTGYNAELTAYLTRLLTYSESSILDIGAGTLLFQRKLKKGIDNVDMNPYMMEAGWKLAKQYAGKRIVAKASLLTEDICPSESYDLINCAFTLPWSILNSTKVDSVESSERVKILKQIHRMLKTDGSFLLTVSENSFDEETFKTFISTLEQHFGFMVDRELSGQSFGRNKIGLSKRLGWCIVAKKQREINLENLSLQNLSFSGEDGTWTSFPKKNKKSKSSVAKKDYPLPGLKVTFDQYEIVNSNNEVKIITYLDEPIRPTKVQKLVEVGSNGNLSEGLDSDSILQYLRGSTEMDYKKYRSDLLRPIIYLTGCNWKQAEELCATILVEIGMKDKRERSIFAILKEIKKRVKNNQL